MLRPPSLALALALALAPLPGCHLIFQYQDRGDGGAPVHDGGKPVTDGQPVSDSGPAPASKCAGIQPSTWKISLVAGSGKQGASDGPPASATLNQPRAVCTRSGTYFIADWGNDRVRWIYRDEVNSPEDRNKNQIQVTGPSALICSSWATTFVMASKKHRVRILAMMSPLSTDWLKTTWFGTSSSGDSDGSNPSFQSPMGVTKAWSSYYLVADTGNHLVRRVFKILYGSAKGYTVAGVRNAGPGFKNGDADKARFNEPADLVWDKDRERAIIADRGNHRIRVWDKKTDKVSTLAGTGAPGCSDGDNTQARFNWPNGVTVASDGSVFVADTGSNAVRLIKEGRVSTIAGDGLPGATSSTSGTPGRLRGPYGVSAVSTDEVLIADTGNHRVWRLKR